MDTRSFMRCIVFILCYCSFFFLPAKSFAAEITLNERDAVVWLEKQTITGRVNGFYVKQLIVFCGSSSFKISVEKKDSTFSFVTTLQKGENKILVKTISGKLKVFDMVNLSLGFKPEPVIKPYVINNANQLTLHLNIKKNPWKEPLHFLWSDDLHNPASCKIKNKNDSTAVINLPSVNGIYYFNLRVSTSKDTARFQTFISKNDSGIHVFNMDAEHAVWIDEAIIYEITPSAFIKNGSYDDITNKLEEIKQLGINTIWLQPVYNTFNKGQGYDVTDYFSLRKDFGTEEQLKKLIGKAKELQLKVLFDFVPNHTSVHHPYAQDCLKYGTGSHYYNFYQHEDDGAAYSSFYKKDKYGFINYFWEDLVNLNYNNEEVQQWVIEACKYWIKEFDIDGYRFDAVWGINARMPSFSQRLKTELKSIKPDLLLLAEDKGAVATVYKAGFDAAYDWTADTCWISHWSWQYEYSPRKNLTIFNNPDVSKRTEMLRQALFNNGDPTNLRLRFIENNDLPRFVRSHQMICTKMAAALLFSLPGIPMIYNGQEIGYVNHPYSKHSVFIPDKSIQSLDSNNLFSFYQKLIQTRKKYSSLHSNNIEDLLVSPENKIVAFHRWKNNEEFIVMLNMDSIPAEATVNIKPVVSNHPKKKAGYFEDVLTNTMFEIDKNFEMKVLLDGYGIRWLLLK